MSSLPRFAAGGMTLALTTLVLAPPGGLDGQARSRVTGVVVDESTGDPLARALVFLGDGQEAETDREGAFLFAGVRPGTYRIAAVSRGCGQVRGDVTVEGGVTKRLKLMVDAPALPWSRSARSRGAAVQVIRAHEIHADEKITLMELLRRRAPDMMRVTPGGVIRVSTRGRNSIAEGDTPLLVMDGMKIRHRVAQVLESTPASDVRRIEIARGAAGAWTHGEGAANGVIRVVTRMGDGSPDPERPASMCDFSWAAIR